MHISLYRYFVHLKYIWSTVLTYHYTDNLKSLIISDSYCCINASVAQLGIFTQKISSTFNQIKQTQLVMASMCVLGVLSLHKSTTELHAATVVYLIMPSGCFPVSILYKSITGHYWPVRVADRRILARYRFIKNASWVLPCSLAGDWI